jgi:hypothetical protein
VKQPAQGGAVTLKWPVNSEDKKKAVETKAAQIAGTDKVTSQIENCAEMTKAFLTAYPKSPL